MNYQPPASWGDSASSHWPPNFPSQPSPHNYQQSSQPHPPSLPQSSSSYDHYAHLSADYPLVNHQRSVPSMGQHGHAHYSPSSHYSQGGSPQHSPINDSPQRFPQQFSTFTDGYQGPSSEDPGMAAGADIVHAYRRLSAEEEQMSESNYGDSSSSSRKKSGGQSQSSRQQLPAKFECVACHARFSYESSAKRHQLNQVKRFRCTVCNQKFARVDYRNWHQRRCESGFRLSVLEQSPG